MRIAYVEDNATNLALVERVASMNRHAVVSYAEGEVAAQELLQERFDLILMDVELAGDINGLQVVRGLRQAGLKTPIIAVTAYAMLGDQERCLEAGCDGYLPKPLPITELLVLLAKYDAAAQARQEPVATAQLVGASRAAGSSIASAQPTATPAPPVPTPPAPPAPSVNAIPASAPIPPTSPAPAIDARPALSPVSPPVPTPPAPTVQAAPTTTPVPPTPPAPAFEARPMPNPVSPVPSVPAAPSVKPAPTTTRVPPLPPGSASNAEAPTKSVPGPDTPGASNPITPDKRVP